ncbi:MAG: hypothetical protein ACJ8C4_03785 [Gemmataceae bacterium]
MIDDQLVYMASARMLMIDHPSTRIELPPPPAAENEAAVMWRPADRPDDMERIPLTHESDRSAAALMGIWIGIQALEISRPDPVQEKPRIPSEDDERDPKRK